MDRNSVLRNTIRFGSHLEKTERNEAEIKIQSAHCIRGDMQNELLMNGRCERDLRFMNGNIQVSRGSRRKRQVAGEHRVVVSSNFDFNHAIQLVRYHLQRKRQNTR